MNQNTTENSLHELSMYVTEKLHDALNHVDEARAARAEALRQLPDHDGPARDSIPSSEFLQVLGRIERGWKLNEWQHIADIYTAMLDRIGSIANAAAEAD